MYWKMWVRFDRRPLVVEAGTMDEAFRAARSIDRDYSAAQPMGGPEAERFIDGMHRVKGATTAPNGWEWRAKGSATRGTRVHCLRRASHGQW